MSSSKKNLPFKIYTFYFIACVIFPLCFLLIFEIGLSILDYGEDFHFLKKDTSVNPVVYRQNRKFIQPYFSKLLKKSAMPMAVPVIKSENAYRVFVLGGSAGAGYPEPPFGFSRIFEVMLKKQFPSANIEVYNTSIVAINSHVLLKMIKDLSPYQADLFVVYIGNNEVVGPYGPGTVFNAFSSNLFFIRAGIFVNNTRTGQLLRNTISRFIKKPENLLTEWKGMEMFAASRIRHNDPRLQKTYQYYERNLKDIVNVGIKSGADVALCSVGSNLKDLAPFASLHSENLSSQEKWNQLLAEGKLFEDNKQYAFALERYQQALDLDGEFAHLHFRLGRMYFKLNEFEKAEKHFIKARDLDVLRFRSVSMINQKVKNVAEYFKGDSRFAYVDVVESFKRNSPNGIVGDEVLYEHVHLNFYGNYLIAQNILKTMQPKFPQWFLDKKMNNEILTLQEAKLQLGYTGYVEYETTLKLLKLIQREPFSTIENYNEIILGLNKKKEEFKKFNEPEGLFEAEKIYYQALKMHPDDKWLHFYLARVLIGQGKLEKAREHSFVASKLMPEYTPAKVLFDLADDLINSQKNVRVNLLH